MPVLIMSDVPTCTQGLYCTCEEAGFKLPEPELNAKQIRILGEGKLDDLNLHHGVFNVTSSTLEIVVPL